jgi:hypothetical protein
MLDAMGPIEVGTVIDTSNLGDDEANFIAALNQLISDASMGKDEVNKMLSGMGFQANFASEPQSIITKEPDLITTHHTIRNRNRNMVNGAQVETYDEVTWSEVTPGKTT